MKWRKLTIFVCASLTLLADAVFGQDTSSSQGQQDEINLGTTIIGNQEQPKVLYIVPWKPVNAADFEDQTIRSQLEMVFGHVEPAEQRRELKYLKELAKTKQQAEE